MQYSRLVAATVLVGTVALSVLGYEPRAATGDDRDAKRDWQARAQATRWKFDQDAADPLHCALKKNGKFGSYEIALRVQRGGRNIAIDVLEDNVVKHHWLGHRGSVFVIREKRLYYADFRPDQNGAAVVAVDLETGKRLWRATCRGIGWKPHSGYRNRLNLGVGSDILVVTGDESLGRYVEFKRLTDGKTVGHKRFERD